MGRRRSVKDHRVGDSEVQLRAVKREKVDSLDNDGSTQQDSSQRRILRSKYAAVINLISDKRDDIASTYSDNFYTVFNEVENLHQQVTKPREQVSDAEALRDLAKSLEKSIKSLSNEGITPVDLVTSLIAEFGVSTATRLSTQEDTQISMSWKDIGLRVSPIFRKFPGCCTMVGPMNTEWKQRKAVARRKRTKPCPRNKPEEVNDTGAEEKTDTDKNMSLMFEILRRKKRVKLECLILNRKSFAQTVENLFALSFLVKDGRLEINVDDNGVHSVSPRNAPSADTIMSQEVIYRHFVFRYDYKDWKLTMDMVPVGEELMPHRGSTNASAASQVEPGVFKSTEPILATPIRIFSRNRGFFVQESLTKDCPDDAAIKATGLRRCNRMLTWTDKHD
ncbi:Nse4 domain-containing protein [Cephalotus follicularis]|uniref:Non-structural maintenance of chromosomes element 4 n=1 Tax=Cephalotus follicularis TaxID=3775 RepID=A0A1Q3C6G4_CEPFO|nr:Nse4 domain-containing protein [Cephalotus follicularis]